MTDFNSAFSENIDNLKRLEALLFAAPGLSSADQLAQALGFEKAQVLALLDVLKTNYEMNSGLRLQEVKNQYQIVTAPEYATDVERFLGLEMSSKLTQAALEALAIIAYKQPATRPEVDAIRGVNSDAVIKSLLMKGLIEELGRSEAPGRPILYGVTQDFLHYFGLDSLEKLPAVDLEGLLQDVDKELASETQNDESSGG